MFKKGRTLNWVGNIYVRVYVLEFGTNGNLALHLIEDVDTFDKKVSLTVILMFDEKEKYFFFHPFGYLLFCSVFRTRMVSSVTFEIRIRLNKRSCDLQLAFSCFTDI